ncbi:MAG TPA: DUF3037 domain-containing protein [Ktedonobacterales bacterium]|nr:DUF3037 domain-containing protein [Ktedonobacterales bacterium]
MPAREPRDAGKAAAGAPRDAAFDYAIIRVVPRVERGECLNAGVVLLCRQRRYLGLRIALDEARLRALCPALTDAQLDLLRAELDGLRRVSEGAADAGPIARLSQAERFHWLVSPGSSMIQPSPVHSGLCADPAAELERLMRELVEPPEPESA